jgi:GAF domain-containing protein
VRRGYRAAASPSGRAFLEGQRYLQIDDARESDFVTLRGAAEIEGLRTVLYIPLRQEGRLLGTIAAARREVRPFSEKEIGILESFATQAAIAIENARLINETRESLQQQTATADVLKVISRSTFDLHSVLQTLVDSAAHLCDADKAFITRQRNGAFYCAEAFGFSREFIEFVEDVPIRPDRGTAAGRALLEHRVIHIADVTADAEYTWVQAQRLGEFRTIVAVPMLREGNPIGVLILMRSDVRPFTGKQIELVTTFADQAVIAIENVRLFEQLQAKTRDLEQSLQQQTATADVLKVISRSAFDLDAVLSTLVQSAVTLSGARLGTIFQKRRELYHLTAQYGYTPEMLAFGRANPIAPSMGSNVGRTAMTGAVVQIPDVLADPDFTAHDYQRVGHYRAMLGIPLKLDGKVEGVFSLANPEPGPFEPRHVELVQTFADQAVIAIENVRLFKEVQARTAQLSEALTYQTSSANILRVIASSPTDINPVLKSIVESACELCDAYDATVVLQHGEDLRISAHHGPIPIGIEKWPINRRWTAGRAFVDKVPVHIEDLSDEKHAEFTDGRELSLRMGHRTTLSVPLLREGESIGAIALRRTEVKPFTEKQIVLLQTFADQAVIAIGNVRLFEEVQARTRDLSETLEQQTATAEVLKVISRSTFDLPAVLRALVETAARLCGADKGTITRQKDGVFYRFESFGFSDEFMDFVRGVPVMADRHSATGRALLEGVVVHIPDVEVDRDYSFSGQRFDDFRSLLGVPMLREGVPVGVITLTRTEPIGFSDKQIELATTFADQAAIAIENVRLFDEVQARTKQLAKSLDDLRTAQDRLIQTEKLASLGQLTAGIAHEIKNPLNFVNNFSELSVELTDELNDVLKQADLAETMRLEVGELTQMLKSNLEKVVQHGKRADSIVKNMLLHSREGSGEHRPVEINAIVDESLNLAYHGARAEGRDFNISLERDFDSAAGVAHVYPQEITRVLLNLISNGFYAATRRLGTAGSGFEPRLKAATRNLGDRVEVRIRDNGAGIPSDIQEKIFNPFFTTKPAGEGTGLGLSMSHDIVVKQHGGTIEVVTEPGSFAEFIIRLPRLMPTQAEAGGRKQ